MLLQTLKHQVKPEHLETVGAGAFNFCRTARCEAVYFNAGGVVLTKADVRQRIGLKETEDPVPLCYCFGFTKAMLVEEIGATGKCTIPQRITAEIKAGATAPVKSAIPKVRAVWATSTSQSKRQCEGRRVRYAVQPAARELVARSLRAAARRPGSVVIMVVAIAIAIR